MLFEGLIMSSEGGGDIKHTRVQWGGLDNISPDCQNSLTNIASQLAGSHILGKHVCPQFNILWVCGITKILCIFHFDIKSCVGHLTVLVKVLEA